MCVFGCGWGVSLSHCAISFSGCEKEADGIPEKYCSPIEEASSMVVVKLSGGLGNQMLQYSFALFLKHLGKEVELDLSLYQYINEHNGPEILSLFPIEQSVELSRSLASFHTRERRLRRYTELARRYRCLPLLSPWKMRHLFRFHCRKYNWKEVDLNVYTPTLEEMEKMDQCVVSGCPNPYYLDRIEDAVRQTFACPGFPSVFDTLLLEMGERESVAVHVRRGDYLNFSGLSLPDIYYQEACSIIEQHCPKAHFYVFSEDVNYVQELFKGREGVTFMEPNRGEKSYLDLFLMAQCKHTIIANSTFSWWAAWLNSHPDKLIIKPQKWWYDRQFSSISNCDITLNY